MIITLSFLPRCISRCIHRHAVNETEENKMSLNSVTYLYTVSCLKPNCAYFHSNSNQEIQVLLCPFDNLNYASREPHYSNEFSHNAIGSDCHWISCRIYNVRAVRHTYKICVFAPLIVWSDLHDSY